MGTSERVCNLLLDTVDNPGRLDCVPDRDSGTPPPRESRATRQPRGGEVKSSQRSAISDQLKTKTRVDQRTRHHRRHRLNHAAVGAQILRRAETPTLRALAIELLQELLRRHPESTSGYAAALTALGEQP